MGRWSDWDAIEAAQEQARAEDAARRARKAELRVIGPDVTPPEPVQASQPVQEAPPRPVEGGTLTYTDERGQRVTRPIREVWAERDAKIRQSIDPVSALRKWAREWLSTDRGER